MFRFTVEIAFIVVSVLDAPAPGGPIRLREYRPPPGAIAPRPEASKCRVRLEIRRENVAGGIELTAVATNISDAPVVLSAPDRCPAGAILWRGLTPDYDFYSTCNKGACASTSRGLKVVWKIAPGKSLGLASVIVRPQGGMCAARLPLGAYEVTFDPPRGTVTCGLPVAAIVQPGKAVARKPVKPGHKCPPLRPCGVGCDGPPARDRDGCLICGCEDENRAVITAPGKTPAPGGKR